MPESELSARVGLVGLGKMGRPMAARLRAAGVAPTVFDVRADVTQAFVARYGGTGAASLAELARCSDVVITMLPDGEAVRQVILGAGRPDDDRMLQALRTGAVVIDRDAGTGAGLGGARRGDARCPGVRRRATRRGRDAGHYGRR